ncbi:hypothetical protein J2755_001960 [Methanohalophilus levihalophilus]|uniref:hypothetical protein n=1 Tax=Methanohalophilus levihalophilus TaxID=1431282 RepID=UPI001AE4CDBE|nr:hypothetical protein [Methanohalophilus levihalophilus]MBP2031012.1 hypothetical protein [Methanohalophilus levihalophilus]
MLKKLTLEDLKKSKDKQQATEEGDSLEGLYDLIIPPGTPSYIIYDIVEEFDLEPLERTINVNIVECDEREVLVLRGELEAVQEAEKYLHQELGAYVNSD